MEFRHALYSEAEELLRRGWRIAPEEDSNHLPGVVMLELPWRDIGHDDRRLVLGALDTLALNLAEHGHRWSDGERTIYEQAVAIARGETWRDVKPPNDGTQRRLRMR